MRLSRIGAVQLDAHAFLGSARQFSSTRIKARARTLCRPIAPRAARAGKEVHDLLLCAALASTHRARLVVRDLARCSSPAEQSSPPYSPWSRALSTTGRPLQLFSGRPLSLVIALVAMRLSRIGAVQLDATPFSPRRGTSTRPNSLSTYRAARGARGEASPRPPVVRCPCEHPPRASRRPSALLFNNVCQ
jgi:hypothetical protein